MRPSIHELKLARMLQSQAGSETDPDVADALRARAERHRKASLEYRAQGQ